MKSPESRQKKFGLIVVSAPSGAGKSTLCARLLQELSHRLSLSVSTTSRLPRGAEQQGREYYFTSADDFVSQIQSGSFAEWAKVHSNFYGTAKKTLENFWKASRHVLLDIDVQGATSLKSSYPDRILTVFISPPSMEELERRLRSRGTETESAIRQRLEAAKEELARQAEFDEVIINDDFDHAFLSLKKVVLEFMDQLEGGQWPKQR